MFVLDLLEVVAKSSSNHTLLSLKRNNRGKTSFCIPPKPLFWIAFSVNLLDMKAELGVMQLTKR